MITQRGKEREDDAQRGKEREDDAQRGKKGKIMTQREDDNTERERQGR